jgi:outer membrane immunogenic protein
MMKIFLPGFALALVARNSRTIPDVGQESARSPRAILIAGSMMKRHLLATVSGIVLMGAAQAADLPQAPTYKAAAIVDVPTWAGFYLGIQGGAARHDGSFNDLTGFGGSPATFGTSKTGGLGGGYAGYNWQSRSFVYGVESDISWVGAKAESLVGGSFGGATFAQSHDISWLATFRARAGLDVESTLVYLTGGLAVAQIKQSYNGFCSLVFACDGVTPPGGMFGGFSQNNTQVGWTVGAGFEHMLDPHWTVRGEMRYVDLGRSSVTCANGAFCSASGNTYRGEFSNTLMTGMVGVGYKF